MTDRTTNSFSYEAVSNPSVPIGLSYQATENKNDKVGGYVDLNLSAEYKFHKNFSIFALGNNLVGAKYQTFKGYKVLGPQILGGVKISF
jgi:outer membrane cobalamin receptor